MVAARFTYFFLCFLSGRIILFYDQLISLERVISHRLVHCQTAVRIEALHLLQVTHLALEERQVVCKHLPVKLLADKLLSVVLIVFCLAGVVNIIVKLNELVPLFDITIEMVDILLADVQEVLSGRHVVKHDHSPDFIEKLLFEVLALVKQFLNKL